jgi:hypothetical protein
MLETTNLLWYSSIAVQFLFCLHLIWTKLAKSYPVFTVLLAYTVARDLAGMYFMRGAVDSRYPLSFTYFWLWTEPFLLLLQIGLTLEVHAKLWRSHRNVLQQTRPLLFFALLMALTAAAIPIRAEALRPGASRLVLLIHFGIQSRRYTSSVLAIFLILSAVLYFVVVGNGQKSDIFRHEGIMAAYFAIYTTTAFLIAGGVLRAIFVNGYFLSAMTLCFIAWFSAFKPHVWPGEG